MTTDSTPETDEYDDKIKAGGDKLQRHAEDRLHEMSGDLEETPEKNGEGDPDSDPS